eukprot:CAMPEP_0119117036 /NCGR_PEP_ID=MMETSP1180-20130426/52619_1 /TAXON_ID=3052 ORGANISM="Chlamydomonas cf sp, Strain CCMP681" /NCGR_SAMPLE_ID=MMETSP1180 /ASSEMBLY_ACC=CAM_ASM_000741 /LENGTH=551 /DNA_ID=CAMNT_0007106251 /DNA_START=246 /DNA_END=1901 /DNA_ORIENTATION=-
MRDNGSGGVTAQRPEGANQPHGQESAGAEGFFTGWCESRRYTVQEVIGKGSYGVVCAAIDNFTKERVAIKKIQNVFDNVADATRILREIKLLRMLKHPDIVDIKHILLPPDPRSFKDIYVVFELLESDLHTVIGANDDLTHDHHKVFLYQLLRGLNFIHTSGVLHRDLKPKNILANSNCKLKICDFGLARPFLSENNVSPVYWTDYVATRWYRAPELCGCFYGRYSQAVDIWSIGCIFGEVLLGKPLFPGRDAVGQLQLMTDLLGTPAQHTVERIGNPKARAFLAALPQKPPRPFAFKFPNAAPAALALLQRLVSFDPADRPTAAEALADPYFQGLPDATLASGGSVSQAQFEFEMHKLDNAAVRTLIYQEILHYHPAVAAMYQGPNGAFNALYPPLTAPHSDVEMRRQFMVAEAQGAASAQQTFCQQQAASLTQQTAALQQQQGVLAAHQAAVMAQQQQTLAAHQAASLKQQAAMQHTQQQQLWEKQVAAAAVAMQHAYGPAAAALAAGGKRPLTPAEELLLLEYETSQILFQRHMAALQAQQLAQGHCG